MPHPLTELHSGHFPRKPMLELGLLTPGELFESSFFCPIAFPELQKPVQCSPSHGNVEGTHTEQEQSAAREIGVCG